MSNKIFNKDVLSLFLVMFFFLDLIFTNKFFMMCIITTADNDPLSIPAYYITT